MIKAIERDSQSTSANASELKPFSLRSFFTLLSRIQSVAEKHVSLRKDEGQAKRKQIEENNKKIANLTSRQGYFHAAPLVVSALYFAFTRELPKQELTALSSSIVQTVNNLFSQNKLGECQFLQTDYFQSLSSEKQTLQILENLPREQMQKLRDMLQQQRAMFQRH